MKKNKKIIYILISTVIVVYIIFILINQQITLNAYKQNSIELSKQIEEQEQYKQELANEKDNINSDEFIEQTAREKLDMYYPNERIYVDKDM